MGSRAPWASWGAGLASLGGRFGRRLRRGKDKAERQRLRDLETTLEIPGYRTRIVAPDLHQHVGAGTLPQPVARSIELLAQTDWMGRAYADQLDQGTARRLWERTLELAKVLEQRGIRVHAPDAPLGLAALGRIASVVADGSSYSPLPMAELLGVGDSVFLSAGGQGQHSFRERLAQLELLMVSVWSIATRDWRSAAWLARQPLTRRFSGFCRHYAWIIQTLFECARRCNSRLGDSCVITLCGYPLPLAKVGHAWNWLIDQRTGSVFAFDLTEADLLLDRGKASSVFNPAFDATRWWNASPFLSVLVEHYARVGGVGYRDERHARLFAALAAPDELAGRELLLRLCLQESLCHSARRRLFEALAERGSVDHRLARRIKRGDFRPSSGDGEAQHALLDLVLS